MLSVLSVMVLVEFVLVVVFVLLIVLGVVVGFMLPAMALFELVVG